MSGNPDEHAYKYSNSCIPETQRCMRQSAPMNKVSILSWSGKTSPLIVLKSTRLDQKSEERLQYDTAHCVNCERMIKTAAIRRPQSIWVLERPWTESDSLTTGLQKFAQNTQACNQNYESANTLYMYITIEAGWPMVCVAMDILGELPVAENGIHVDIF